MKWIDRGLSVLLILGGIGHTYGVLNFYKDPHTLFWSLTATELVLLIAAINLLRTSRLRDRTLATVAACASAAYLMFTLRFGQIVGNIAWFTLLGGLLATVVLGLATLASVVRRRSAGHAAH